MGLFSVVAAALLWAAGATSIKKIEWESPFGILGFRALVATTLLAFVLRRIPTLSRPVIIAGLCFAANSVLYVWALRTTSMATAFVLANLLSLWTMGLDEVTIWWQGKSVSTDTSRASKWLAVVLGIAGTVFIFAAQISIRGGFGELLALFSGMFLAFGIWFLSLDRTALLESDPRGEDAVMLCNCVLSLLAPLALGLSMPEKATGDGVLILFAGSIGLLIPQLLYLRGIKKTSPFIGAVTLCAVEAMASVGLGLFFFGESLTFMSTAGMVMIVLSIIIVSRAKNP